MDIAVAGFKPNIGLDRVVDVGPMRGSNYDATNEWLELLPRPKIGRSSEITKPRSADQRKVWTSTWPGPTIGRKTNIWSHSVNVTCGWIR